MKCFKPVFILLLVFFSDSFEFGQRAAEEYTAKAAFIYNFTKFIEWQELDKEEDFTIGITQNCPIIESLRQIASSKKIQDKKINIILLEEDKNKTCQIIFLPGSMNNEKSAKVIKEYLGKNTLIISEKKGLITKGSGINFILQDDKIKFEINRKALEKSNLKISSQLLKLAVKVIN